MPFTDLRSVHGANARFAMHRQYRHRRRHADAGLAELVCLLLRSRFDRVSARFRFHLTSVSVQTVQHVIDLGALQALADLLDSPKRGSNLARNRALVSMLD